MRVARLGLGLGLFVGLVVGNGVTSVARAQVKPRFMIAFDTSGSMQYTTTGSTEIGFGIGRPAVSGDPAGLVRDGVFYGCGTLAGYDTNSNCFPDDTRMFIAKEAVRNMVLSFGDVEWALARFAQSQGNYNYNVTGMNSNCTTCSSQSLATHYQGQGQTTCTNAGYTATGQVLVGFPYIATQNHATKDNTLSILKWVDNVETNYVSPQAAALVDHCNHANGGDCELLADGYTPLGGLLYAAYSYMSPIRTADSARNCRPYNVILITDGDETCSTSPATRATELLAQGIKTYVIGFATTTTSLNAIATNGGTTAPYFAANQAQLSAALSDIVAASLKSETCNGLDDDCDGKTDEQLPFGQFLSCDQGGKRSVAQNDMVKLIRDANGNLVYPANLAATTPLAAKVVCGAVSDLCTNDMMCSGTCSNRDDDCDTLIDENGAKNACGVCPGAVESCNGLDDNCDGYVDNSVGSTVPYSICSTPASCTGPVSCGLGVGQCVLGSRACVGGVLQACVGAGSPSAEVCDLVDNDCNGLVDDISRTCPVGTDTGECNRGTQFCRTASQSGDANGWRIHAPGDPLPGQAWCEGQVLATPELCDNLDQNCDGHNTNGATPLTDPRLGVSCGPGVAECDGVVACDSVAQAPYCMGARAQPYPGEICNGADEDCDSKIDETPAASMGSGPTGAFCGTTPTSTGECNMGAFACVTGGWACVGEIPPAPELCDNLDQDCDGQTMDATPASDPRLAAICGTDVGECTAGATVCVAGAPSCTPVQGPVPEICDGLDNDCDGLTDEQVIAANDNRVGVACSTNSMGAVVAPATQPCPGGAGTCSCTLGVTACSSNAIVCQGNVGPQAEVCDNFDNDCDGTADDGNPGGGGACGNTTGECTAGAYQCVAGSLVCQGGQGPVPEVCDGDDNDCDGQNDDGVTPANDPQLGQSCTVNPSNGNLVLTSTQPCPLGAGTCSCVLGATACSAGGVVCSGHALAQTETCNNFDDDCDGVRDEGNPGGGGACGTDEGLCSPGTYQCTAGSLQCTGGQGPVAERCDGLDNDCDGQLDEGVSPATDPALGVACYQNASTGALILNPSQPCPNGANTCSCKLGVTGCSSGGVVCTNHVLPQTELCDNFDNNCNGTIDDGNPGGGGACGTGTGECAPGMYACVAGALQCNGGQGPVAERCNGLDDDCDGQIDDGVSPATDPNLGLSCRTDPVDGDVILTSTQPCPLGANSCPCTLGDTVCSGGAIICDDMGPEPELCDGIDNDCDGTRDEAMSPNPDPRLDATCGSSIGQCRPGPTTCVNGNPSCTPAVGPVTESCNGLDDNCNGLVDDAIPGDGTAECWDSALNPNPGVGTCKKGVSRCVLGAPKCDGEIRPGLEVCDGLDSNCNGLADNNPSENPGGGQVCGSDVGICESGLTQCVFQNNLWFLACNGGVSMGTEICNGDDDDCDGLVDEGDLAGGDCYEDAQGNSLDPMDGTGVSGVGECHDGVYACQVPVDGSGAPTGPARNVCVNAQGPTGEFCDDKDNDCDGETDEGNPPGAVGASGESCGSDVGVCTMGTLECVDGEQICAGETGPSVEICDGMNNDCDQVCTTPGDCDELVDEGIPLGEACSTSGLGDIGECVPGRWICAEGGQLCDGEVLPTSEVCDALDNDCDNKIDENLGVGAVCGKDEGECDEGTQQCVKGVLVCVGSIVEQPETCDCDDNDCDGTSDEQPDTGALCPAGSECVQCQCALPCSDAGEFGIRCPTGKAAVEQDGACFCVGDACDDTACATETHSQAGVEQCSPTSPLGTCACKNNACSFRCDGVACTDGTVCNPLTGACERESCVLPQFACEANERCNGASGECEADPCAGAGCDADQACRDGDCFGSCAKVECDSGELCKGGSCEADPCATVSCPTGQACNPVDSTCVAPSACVLSGCGTGTVCNVVEGCVSDPCLSTTCPDRQICVLGECVSRCSGGQVDCNETCIDPMNDPAHCGASDDCTGSAAGAVCGDGEFCVGGECTSSCPEGRVGCAGRCIDPLTDSDHCGANGDCQGDNAGKTCQSGTVCDNGTCEVFVQPGVDGGTGKVDAGGDDSTKPDDRSRVIAAGGGGCACSVPAGSQSSTHGSTAWALALGLCAMLVYRRRQRLPRVVRSAASVGLTAVIVALAAPNQGCNVEPFCIDCGEPQADGDSGTDEGIDPGIHDSGTGFVPPDGGGSRDAGGNTPDGSTPDAGGNTVNGEQCNGEDDDEDGKTDEGFDLNTDLSNCGACGQACVPAHAFGACEAGNCTVRGCDVGYLNLNDGPEDGCEYACIPTDDNDTICDLRDNDCNGQTDEDLDLQTDRHNCGECGITCSFLNASTGASCVAGDCVFDPSACDPGWHDQDGDPANGCEYACVKNPDSPNAELCNLSDDDCDRAVDEGVTDLGQGRTVGASCGTAAGECAEGAWRCGAGQPVCMGQVGPKTETCNGLDDDCDGNVDVGTPAIGQQCGIATGACNPGQLVIPSGGCSSTVGLVCGGPSFQGPVPETCNGVDDDCDGLVDEPDTVTGLKPEAGQECTNDQSMPRGINFAPTSTEDGQCQHGVTVCASGLLVCQGEIVPSTELCDGVDNDCDAVIDDNMVQGGSDPQIGAACGEDRGQCTAGQIVCNVAGQYFCDRSGQVGPTDETCDGTDNDCDGTIDERAGPSPVSDPDNRGAEGGQSCEVDGSGDIVLTTTARCTAGDTDCPCKLGVSVCSGGNLGCLGYVMPAVAESCDLLDNDCDGTVNEGNPGGGGACGSDVGECGKQRGSFVCSGGSQVCMGARAPVAETCNGLDDDCDGLVDDGVTAAADPRLAVSCYTNASGALVLSSTSRCASGVPCPCTLGATVCSAGAIACSGDLGPGTEICDNIDNDCDGVRDEGNPGGGGSCGTDVGECSKGSFVCTNGAQVCTGGQGPTAETCDGQDDDCDNLIDDNVQVADDNRLQKACRINPSTGALDTSGTNPCAAGVPCTCTLGTTVCSAGAIDCSGDIGPGVEDCDNFDDDCDGVRDDGNPGGGGSCGTATGECNSGTFMCTAGAQVCTGGTGPATEICNGLDDDCDGLIDDGVTMATDNRLGQSCRTNPSTGALVLTSTNPCPLGAGTCPCTLGATICSAGAIACGAETGPATETCDTQDNDCDGVINDGNPGGGGSCGTTTGECNTGTYSCTAAGTLVCNGGTQPSVEICDGLDNDCNGVADDNVTAANDPMKVGRSCYDNAMGQLVLSTANRCPLGAGTCPCTLGTTVCSMGAMLCQGDVGPAAELCDVYDQNCDGNSYAGVVDLGSGRVTGAACGTSTGECSQGTWACNAGTVECNGQTLPAAEDCDGKDDDCNGVADNGVTNLGMGRTVGAACGVDTGECSFGTWQCAAGQADCSGDVVPATEICDAKDNDCDGANDDGFTPYTSIVHCNGCNQPCNFPSAVGDPQAIATCSTGSCGILACKTGYVNRDGVYANGCEYQCTVSGTVDVCDGINNDCDFNVDENVNTVPPQVCVPKNTGVCATNPSGLTPGCTSGAPVCNVAANIHPEYQATETKCDGLDNDCDAKVDEGYDVGVSCNNSPLQGACFATGSKQCNAAKNGTQCVLSTTPPTPGQNPEICDGIDNNCDGTKDNFAMPTPAAPVSGISITKVVDTDPNWNDVWMMRYEASRADAQTTNIATQGVCSRTGVFPWANVNWNEASAACCALNAPPNGTCNGNGSGWRLCDVEDWETGCEGPGGTCNWAYDDVVVSQNPITNITCTTYNGTAGSASGNGTNTTHVINVPATGTVTDVNVINLEGDVSAFEPIGFTLSHGGTTRQLLNNNNCSDNNDWRMGFDDAGTTGGFDNSGGTNDCTNGDNGDGLTFVPAQSLSAFNTLSATGDWTLTVQNAANCCGGNPTYNVSHTLTAWSLQVCYAVSVPQTAPLCSAENPSYPGTCNGSEVGPATCSGGGSECADLTASASFPECYADWGANQQVYDLSGNLKEWTNTSPLTDVYYLRGGSYNNVEDGRQCDFGITSANRTFRFPTTGFRCCYYVP